MTTARPLRVMVVDDSPFSRKAITRMLTADAEIEVVAQAGTGEEALERLAGAAVDVVTLDLEMPGLGGLGTLQRIRREHRAAVVVLSGAAGAAATLQALDLGAFDVVAKPGGHLAIHEVTRELVAKVRAAAGRDRPARAVSPPPAPRPPRSPEGIALVVIGTSTGGPPALQQVIPRLPADFPLPVLVLQHMPPGYTRALAERLDRQSAVTVKEAEDGDGLVPGRVLVAPSGFQLGLAGSEQAARVAISETCPFPSYYRPSIDHTFNEAARCFGRRALGVVLTGMGSDGAAGLGAIKTAGGLAWAQDEATSTIYGMPRAAFEAGVVDVVFPLEALPTMLTVAATAAISSW